MINSFGGRNFYSFRDDFRVDFRVPETTLERNIFVPTNDGKRCNTVMGVFGANASGKTHLLQVLGFLQAFIQHYAQIMDPDSPMDEVFFQFVNDPNKETELFLEFEMDGDQYRYDVKFTPERVLLESLKIRKQRLNVLFEKKWDAKKGKYSLKHQGFGKVDIALAQRSNASLISTAILVEHPIARRFDQFFNKFYGNLSQWGRIETHDPGIENLLETARFFNEKQELLDWVNSRLAHFDLGLDSVSLEEQKFMNKEGKESTVIVPYGVHVVGKKRILLPIFQESRGTQSLFVMLRYILPVLKEGGLAFIDEFEIGLHSHMLPRLIELFYSEKHNPKKAQLIFSTHADFVIQELEKYQMLFVEKDNESVSDVYRLDDIQGVRNDENHYAKYHAGAYGGVPEF